MADESENLDFTSELSMQDEHAMTISTMPPEINASNMASSSHVVYVQSLNSLWSIPQEGVPTEDVPISSSSMPGLSPSQPRLRSLCSSSCFWMSIDLCSIIIQIILLVVISSVYRDEHPHVALRVWVIGYIASNIIILYLLFGCYKIAREQSNRLPQAFSRGTEVGVRQTQWCQRFGRILKWMKRGVNCFILLWFVIGSWALQFSREARLLHSLCIFVLVFMCFRFMLPWMAHIERRAVPWVRDPTWPHGASERDISALPTYKFHTEVSVGEGHGNAGHGDGGHGDGGHGDGGHGDGGHGDGGHGDGGHGDTVVACCICLDQYREGVEVKELRCAHHFHSKCINRWLQINGSCPVCKLRVDAHTNASLTT